MSTAKLVMPELSVSQASKEITHNEALAIIDQLVQARVVDKDLATPPGSPANGAAYIVASSPTGAWTGHTNKIAYWLTATGVWQFLTPAAGWEVWVTDEAARYRYNGSAWVSAAFDIISALVSTEVEITGAITLTGAAFGKMHVCSGTSADYTVGLPAASGNTGKVIGLRMSSTLTKVVSIDANASELIDGATVRPMWANEVAILLCDGAGWIKIAGKTIPMQAAIRRVSAQSIPSNTFTDVDFDSIQKDSAGMADLAMNRINFKRAGTYQIRGRTVYPDPGASTTVGTTRQVRIYKNGSYLDNAFPDYGQRIPVVNSPLTFTAADYVGINLYQNNGVAEDAVNTFLLVQEVPTW